VEDGAPPAGKFGEQRERDDALAAASPAGYDDDLLGGSGLGPLDRMEDQLVREALLSEQSELLPVFELVCGDGEELTAGPDCAGQQAARRGLARRRRQVLAKEVQELVSSLAREHRAPGVGRGLHEVAYGVVCGVVEVGDAAYRVLPSIERANEVLHVLAIAVDLHRWVKAWAAWGSVDEKQLFVVLPRLGTAPLLELNYDVRVLAGVRVRAGQDRVHPFAGQWKLVLDEYFDLAQAGVNEIAGKMRQAAVPRPHLGFGDQQAH
jgi:hypothetical protein